MFLEISQNSQENTCTRVSFFKRDCNFIKKDILAQVISCEFCEISKKTFSIEHLQTTTFSRGKVSLYRSSRLQMLFKIGALKNFANVIGKHLWWSPSGLQLYYEKTPTQVFFCRICQIFKNIFFYSTPPEAASDYRKKYINQCLLRYIFLQTYHINYYKRQWWNDYRLKFNASFGNITLCMPPKDIIWVPDITFVNANEANVIQTAQRVIINPNGDIYTSQRYSDTTQKNEAFHLGFLQQMSHLLKKSLMENFISCLVSCILVQFLNLKNQC